MLKQLKKLFLEEDGQGLTEYGLIIGLIVVVVIAVMLLLGDGLNDIFTNIQTKLESVT